jgi:septal ring factor EnvC (AmiA/AmiB activator)
MSGQLCPEGVAEVVRLITQIEALDQERESLLDNLRRCKERLSEADRERHAALEQCLAEMGRQVAQGGSDVP